MQVWVAGPDKEKPYADAKIKNPIFISNPRLRLFFSDNFKWIILWYNYSGTITDNSDDDASIQVEPIEPDDDYATIDVEPIEPDDDDATIGVFTLDPDDGDDGNIDIETLDPNGEDEGNIDVVPLDDDYESFEDDGNIEVKALDNWCKRNQMMVWNW